MKRKLKATWHKRATRVGRIIFLLLYIAYSLSPIAYSVDSDAPGIAQDVDGYSTPQMFVLNLVCDTLMADDATGPSRDSGITAHDDGDTIIGRKRKAIISPKQYVVDQEASIADKALLMEHEEIRSKSSFRILQTPIHLQDGYYIVNSGLSPPLA